MIYASKHFDSIQTYVKSQQQGETLHLSEPIQGRANDLILYMILFKALVEEFSPVVITDGAIIHNINAKVSRVLPGAPEYTAEGPVATSVPRTTVQGQGNTAERKDGPLPGTTLPRVPVGVGHLNRAIHILGNCGESGKEVRDNIIRAMQEHHQNPEPSNGSLRWWQGHIKEWADRVFPDRTIKGSLSKLVVEEISEFVQAGCKDPQEYADLLIMIMDLASQAGIDCEQALRVKMLINQNRTWARDPESGNYHHVVDSEGGNCD